MKRITALLISVCVLFSLLTTYASAAALGVEDSALLIDDERNYLNSYIPTRNARVLGLENRLFNVTASSLTQLITTRGSNKYFYGDILNSNGDVYYVGTLSTYYGTSASAGFCVYDQVNAEYIAVHRTWFSDDEFTVSEMIPTDEFDDDEKYFGFINGRNTGGTSGTVQFWYLNYDA